VAYRRDWESRCVSYDMQIVQPDIWKEAVRNWDPGAKTLGSMRLRYKKLELGVRV